jgi:hypothetical protein
MYSDELSNVLRTALQPVVKFRQFCDAKDAMDKGLGRGQLYSWNTYSDVTTGGNVLAEDAEMPTTSFSIKQQSLTVTELGLTHEQLFRPYWRSSLDPLVSLRQILYFLLAYGSSWARHFFKFDNVRLP